MCVVPRRRWQGGSTICTFEEVASSGKTNLPLEYNILLKRSRISCELWRSAVRYTKNWKIVKDKYTPRLYNNTLMYYWAYIWVRIRCRLCIQSCSSTSKWSWGFHLKLIIGSRVHHIEIRTSIFFWYCLFFSLTITFDQVIS